MYYEKISKCTIVYVKKLFQTKHFNKKLSCLSKCTCIQWKSLHIIELKQNNCDVIIFNLQHFSTSLV